MPSRGEGAAHAVTRTTESPTRTNPAPSACFAYFPVSKERGVPLMSTSCLCICASGRTSCLHVVRNLRLPPDVAYVRLLLADAQASNQLRVALGVLALQVIQQASALADQLEEAAARVM